MKRNNWPTFRLDELCDVRIGRTPRRDTPAYWGGDAVWVTISELDGGIIADSKEHVSDLAVETVMPEPIPEGTLLFSFKLSIGKMGIAGCPLYTNEAIAALPIRQPDKLSRDFLRYALMAKSHEGGANTAVLGKVLNKEKVSAIGVPLPPLDEQRRIVAILDEAEALRQLRARADARMAEFIPALFNQMFEQEYYPLLSIGELLEKKVLLLHKDGNHGSLYPRAEDFNTKSGVPFLSAKCVEENGEIDVNLVECLREDKANQLRIGWIEKGDVLLAHNASVGKVALYEGQFPKALIGTSLTAYRPNPEFLSSEYLFVVLRSSAFQEQLFQIMKQTTRNQVPITAQRALKIIVPPLALQREFAARVAEARAMQDQQAQVGARLEEGFQAVLHRAFAGEL